MKKLTLSLTNKQFNMKRPDPDELFDHYITTNKLSSTEGATGVRNLETITKALGYGGRNGGQFVGDWPLQNFLADNPGAVQALYEFIGNWVPRNDEWVGRLSDDFDDTDGE